MFRKTKSKLLNASNWVKILKPHGSLNWYTEYKSETSLLTHLKEPKKRILISRRTKIPLGLRYKGRQTFPMIIPPLSNKGEIFKKSIIDKIWSELREELSLSSRIIVYGYSCPQADMETFNLFSQIFTQSNQIKELFIINPDPSVFHRLQDAIKAPAIHYYRDLGCYLKKTSK